MTVAARKPTIMVVIALMLNGKELVIEGVETKAKSL